MCTKKPIGFYQASGRNKKDSHPKRVAIILARPKATLANESCRFLIARIAFAIPRVLIKHPDELK